MTGEQLKAKDWKTCTQLVAELAELPIGSFESNRLHFLDRLAAAVGADSAFWVTAQRRDRLPETDPLRRWRPVAVWNNLRNPAIDQRLAQLVRHQPNYVRDPFTQGMTTYAGQTRVHLRAEWVTEQQWQASPFVNEVLRPVDVADRMIAAAPIAKHTEVYLGFDRGPRRSRFNERDATFLSAIVRYTTWFLRRLAQLESPLETRLSLAPHERQVLTELLSGQSEKQLAAKLGLTVRSAHQVVAAIYRKLGVHSRAELMALWLK